MRKRRRMASCKMSMNHSSFCILAPRHVLFLFCIKKMITNNKMTTTKLDFKTVLKNWQIYQKARLMMENQFNCYVIIANNPIQATLTFLAEEQSIQVRGVEVCVVNAKVKLEQMNGFNPIGNSLELVMKPELGQQNIILEFATREIQTAVLTKLENFGDPTLPTPSGSSEGSSSGS